MSKKKSLKEREKQQDNLPGYDPIISHDSEPVPVTPPEKEKLILDKGLISQGKKKERKKTEKN